MGNVFKIIAKTLATGVAKTYWDVEDEFVATGTSYYKMYYYTAAHPSLGLWLCGMDDLNQPVMIFIGFIDWDNIARVVVNIKNECVFVVPKDFEKVFEKTDFLFRKIYKKAFTHRMSDTGEMAFLVQLELCAGNILPYLSTRVPMEVREEKEKTSIWFTLGLMRIFMIAAVAICLVAICFISSIFGA